MGTPATRVNQHEIPYRQPVFTLEASGSLHQTGCALLGVAFELRKGFYWANIHLFVLIPTVSFRIHACCTPFCSLLWGSSSAIPLCSPCPSYPRTQLCLNSYLTFGLACLAFYSRKGRQSSGRNNIIFLKIKRCWTTAAAELLLSSRSHDGIPPVNSTKPLLQLLCLRGGSSSRSNGQHTRKGRSTALRKHIA